MSGTGSMRIATRALSRTPGDPCGDVTGAWEADGAITLCVADGLGHGPHAREAARAAVAFVEANLGSSLDAIFEGCDRALRSTRGVAMGVAVIRGARLTYAGIGNTRVLRVGRTDKRFMGDPGILGTGYRHLLVDSTELAPGDLVFLFTDGLDERACVPYPGGEGGADLESMADEFMTAWRRGRDDAGLLIYEHGGAE